MNEQQVLAPKTSVVQILQRLDRISNRTLWLIVFVYVVIIALFIQLVALPNFFPQIDNGNGLLARTDTALFHDLAVEQSRAIKENGWSAWTLYPQGEAGFSIAGIVSAVYALTNSESPALMIPLNAAIHATTAIILLSLVRLITNTRRGAVAASLPFVFFPSSLNWVAQIHKDGIFILGILLTLCGLTLLARLETWKRSPLYFLLGYAILVLGLATTWFIRPYGLQLIYVFSAIIAVPSILLLLYYVRFKGISIFQALAHAVLFVGLLVGMTGFLRSPISQSVEPGDVTAVSEVLQAAETTSTEIAGGTVPITPLPLGGADEWQRSAWLPGSLDQQLHTLSIFRDNVLTFGGDTDIDRTARMSSAQDFIAYIPRALQISLFAPFPDQWFGSGSLGILSAMRPIVGLEMLVTYLLLPFGLYAIWRWRHPQLWLTIGFCLFFMVMYSYITPNAGTLHRVRYGFMTTFLAISVAALWNLFNNRDQSIVTSSADRL